MPCGWRACLLFLLALGCERPTQIMVVVTSNVPISELELVDVRAGREGGALEGQHLFLRGWDSDFPLIAPIVYGSGDLGPIRIEIEATTNRGEKITRRARTVFQRGEVIALELPLHRACADSGCPQDCVRTQGTLDAGLCRDVLDQSALPPYEEGSYGDGCAPTCEDPNGEDDDCDGLTEHADEADRCCPVECSGACVATADLCGGSCADCDGLLNIATCEGACEFTCAPSYGDCDGNLANGCEQALDTQDHCGACGARCPVACRPDGVCPNDPRAIASSWGHTCVRTVDGRVRCWGDNGRGQVGVGGPTLGPTEVSIASSDDGSSAIEDPTSLATGELHTCALVANAMSIECIGDDGEGQLGGVPRVSGNVHALPLVAGARHTCSGATCWGANALGQAGGPASATRLPSLVEGVPGMVAGIAAGADHTCMIADGSIRCFGRCDGDGLLGTTDCAAQPVDIPLVAPVRIAAGHEHTCAQEGEGGVYCWGDASAGQLGGATVSTPIPDPPWGMERVFLGGGGAHTCALRAVGASDAGYPGRLYCWGANDAGQVTGTASVEPVAAPIEVLTHVLAFATGTAHTCAIARADVATTDRFVACWGTIDATSCGEALTTCSGPSDFPCCRIESFD